MLISVSLIALSSPASVAMRGLLIVTFHVPFILPP